MQYTTFVSKVEEPDTLPGLLKLGIIPIKEAVKVGEDGKIRLIARGSEWIFRLTTQHQYDGNVKYYVCISDRKRTPISSTSIVKYIVKRDEREGDWYLHFQTRSGSIYGVNIGNNADFNAAAGL